MVCPGDVVVQLPETGVVRIGGGLLQDGAAILAVKAGFLRAARGNKLWVEGRQKRYAPAAGDSVVGVVREKHSENFDVDINAPFKATLPVLAFEGATRRNRPNLQVREARGGSGAGLRERAPEGCDPWPLSLWPPPIHTPRRPSHARSLATWCSAGWRRPAGTWSRC